MKNKTNRKELVSKFKDFFESKNHKMIPPGSLVPINDPTVLFTTAGMHPLVPYLLGQKHPLGKRLANVQPCIRTTDIEEVGDSTHHTFFEMLGNWSLGDYWKKESIEWSLEFLTKNLGLDKEKLAVSVFEGDKNSPKDEESAKVWENLGIKKERIAFLGKKDNWWGPAGEKGPCGPDTEIFYWAGKGKNAKTPKKFDPENENWIEIWNNVFMQYNKIAKDKYEPLKQKNVDTGMGVERTVAVLNDIEDDYLTGSFKPLIKEIEKISGKKYGKNKKRFRIISDHVKASTFVLAEKIAPGNSEQGYVLRRLIRRAILNLKKLGVEKKKILEKIAKPLFNIYDDYEKLRKNKDFILKEFGKEEEKFERTLEKGLSKFESMIKDKKALSGKEAFLLYQSYGFPIELTLEMAEEKNVTVDVGAFEKEFEKHQKLSKTASKGRFASGLADHSEKTKRLHTATHLLNEALRQILGKEVKQRGSNITPKRLRFDFSFPRALTKEEIKAVEELVNKKIEEGLKVESEEMPLKKALKSGAQSEFNAKYPDVVSIYTIEDSNNERGWFSKEICTGPHVKNTKEIGHFKILKERSSSAGVRRIRAIVE